MINLSVGWYQIISLGLVSINQFVYCLSGPPPVADVRSLTHYGEPYDGNTRFFRSTLFVAAVRASYGESCLLHGVEWMPPKVSKHFFPSMTIFFFFW